MKREIILIVSTILTVLLSAQNLKTVKTEDKQTLTKEVYHVLKADKTTKHGEYKKFQRGILTVNGFYENGAKDSVWTFYSAWGKKYGKGNYKNDKKTGIWEYFDYDGLPELTIDIDSNKVLKYSLNKSIKDKDYRDTIYKVITTNGVKRLKLDRPPFYAEGYTFILSTLASNIKYPIKALENNVSGRVEITFTIDTNGKTSNHKITKRIGYDCDEESLRVVKMIPDNWLPGILNGQPVSIEYTMPVNFKLQ